MTRTTRKNHTVKAFQSFLSEREKLTCNSNNAKEYIRLERKMIGAINNRGENLTCEKVKGFADRYLNKIGEGLSKVAFAMDDIVICFNKKNITNQIKKQLDAWNKISLTADADYFNPVLSYGLHRGDKLGKEDNRYIDKSFIVSQRARTYATLEETIRQMYRLNGEPFDSQTIEGFKNRINEAAARWEITDLHDGNFGLIMDYSKREYKVVIIDYAL